MRFSMLASVIVGLVTCATPPAFAETPEEKGRAIAQHASDANDGYRDYSANGKMVLSNAGGGKATRDFDFKSLEQSGGDKSLLVFNWPGDIRDTALLTHSNTSGEDSQWLFLPADKRVKRIAGSGRSGSFVGSEFSYEDFLTQDAGKFTYLWLKDDGSSYVVQRTPTYASGYKNEVIWYNKNNYTISRSEYYNKGGALLKVMTAGGYQQFSGKFWRPSTMTMINQITGKQTILTWSGHRFGQGLTADDFTTRALERAR